jgi:hypothetical protein
LPVYRPAYKIIDNYCAEKGLLMNKFSIAAHSQYTLFGTEIFQHAIALANLLTTVCPYVRMDTFVKNKEFGITIDNMRIATMFAIDQHTMDVMSEKIENLKYLTPDIELCLIYHILSDPSKYDHFDEAKDRELVLWKKLKLRSEKTIVKKIGNQYTDIVLDWLKTKPLDYVIVSESGVALSGGKRPLCTRAIQFVVSNMSFATHSIKEHFAKHANINVGQKIASVNVLGDWRLKKSTIFFTNEKNKTQYICDIYNAGSYDLIPFTVVGGFNVGTPTVLIRFLFVNLWFAKVMEKKGVAGQQHYSAETIESICVIHEKIYDSDFVPQLMGVYVNEIYSKKMSNDIMPYFPMKYFNDNGQFMK